MKLRNKKTWEIGYLHSDSDNQVQVARNTGYNYKYYDTLAELVEEWEDVPEPKKYWFIGEDGNPHTVPSEHYIFIERLKEIGNYFESDEETKQAVEKLKAFKRLKDKGFRFITTPATGWLDVVPGKFQIEINADMPAKWVDCDAVRKDLKLLFSEEED